MIHMTGMMGFAHAYYLLGLRHADGWIGYGAKINSGRFAALAPTDAPLILECKATRMRRSTGRVVARYVFTFTQTREGATTLVYEGDQSAWWMNVNHKDPERAGGPGIAPGFPDLARVTTDAGQ